MEEGKARLDGKIDEEYRHAPRESQLTAAELEKRRDGAPAAAPFAPSTG